MSVTRSSQKVVSVETSVNDETAAAESKFDLLFEVEIELANAIRDGLALLFKAAETGETSAEESVNGYAYQRVAAQQCESGLAYVEMNKEVETVEDVYDKVFHQLGEETASHRDDTQVARGVKYDRSLMGVPSGQIAQKKAEMHCMERDGWICPETPRLINGAWGGQEGSVPDGKDLETQERIAGREWELDLIRKQAAGNFNQEGRPRRTREEVVAEHRARKKEREQRVIGSYCEVSLEHDSRHQLGKADPELLGEVNRTAARMAEKYDVHRPGIARKIAARVSTSGTTGSVASAAMTARDSLLEDETVIRPIAEIDRDADRVSIAGEITTLYYPHSPSQYQVGIIEDESGAAKVTVWRKSDPRVTLREGDHVVIKRASPGEYRGQKTLAVRHDTLTIVREEGDGPAKRGCHPDERNSNPTPQNVDRNRSGGMGDPVPRPAAARHPQYEKTLFTAELVPEPFHDWVDSDPDAETVKTKQGKKAYAIITRRRYPNYSPGKAKEKEQKERARLRWKNISYEPEWHERIRRVDDEKYIKRQYLLAGQGWGQLDWDLPWPGREDTRIPR